jgi:hypothetical protein
MDLKRRLKKLKGTSEGGPPYHILIHGKTYESDISIAEITRTAPSDPEASDFIAGSVSTRTGRAQV